MQLCARSCLSTVHKFYHLIFTTFIADEETEAENQFIQLIKTSAFHRHASFNKISMFKVERKVSRLRGHLLCPAEFHFLQGK